MSESKGPIFGRLRQAAQALIDRDSQQLDLSKELDALRAALAEPEQSEPVAWRPKLEHPIPYTTGRPQPQDITHWVVNSGCEIEYAYTAPPRREPLSDEHIKELIPDGDGWKYEVGFDEATKFARAIETAVRKQAGWE